MRLGLPHYTNVIHLTVKTPSFVQPSVPLGELIIKTNKATRNPSLLISQQQENIKHVFYFGEVPCGAKYKFAALDPNSTVIAFHPRGAQKPSKHDFSSTARHRWDANSITIIECAQSNQENNQNQANQAQQIRIVTRVRE